MITVHTDTHCQQYCLLKNMCAGNISRLTCIKTNEGKCIESQKQSYFNSECFALGQLFNEQHHSWIISP